MKLEYLSDSTIPSHSANSVHVMKMCNAFCKRGVDVTLNAYIAGPRDVAEIRARYKVESGFRIQQIPELPLPMTRRVTRVLWYRVVQRSAELPDVVYGRDAYGVLARAATSPRTPVFFEAHTPPGSSSERKAFSRLLQLGNLGGIVVISEALRSELQRIYGSALGRVLVAHDGADEFKTGAEAPLSWPSRRDVMQIGYVGSLLQGKGASIVASLAGLLPEYDFHVVGGSPGEVDRLRLGAGTPSNLSLHGHVSHAAVGSYLTRFDVVLYPAQSRVLVRGGRDIARWMSPLKLFEYMAAGKTMVCSDLPTTREIIVDGVDALLAQPADLDDWVAKIRTLARDPALRERLASSAHRKLMELYSWDTRAGHIMEFVAGYSRGGNR